MELAEAISGFERMGVFLITTHEGVAETRVVRLVLHCPKHNASVSCRWSKGRVPTVKSQRLHVLTTNFEEKKSARNARKQGFRQEPLSSHSPCVLVCGADLGDYGGACVVAFHLARKEFVSSG